MKRNILLIGLIFSVGCSSQPAAGKRNAWGDIVKREYSKKAISHKDYLGHMICKDGVLRYQSNLAGETKEIRESGQIWGYLEDFSQDGYTIKFRTAGHATEQGTLGYQATSAIQFEGFITTPGVVYWDNVSGWYPCRVE